MEFTPPAGVATRVGIRVGVGDRVAVGTGVGTVVGVGGGVGLAVGVGVGRGTAVGVGEGTVVGALWVQAAASRRAARPSAYRRKRCLMGKV